MRRVHVLIAFFIVAAFVALVVWSNRPPARPGPGESGSRTMMTYTDPETGKTFEAPLDEEEPPVAPSGKQAEYAYQCLRHNPPRTWTGSAFGVSAKCPECGGLAGPIIRRAPPKKSVRGPGGKRTPR
jgi:hypothetical protein